MNILYEDDDIIIADKAPGQLSEISADGKDIVSEISKYSGTEVSPVNRLDRVAGGAILLAKNAKSASALSEAMSSGSFVKQYVCAIQGNMDPPCGEMEDFLFKDSRTNKVYSVKTERKGARKASLSYETLGTADNISLLIVTLHTGRTHQIRVQFASRRHPLLGDGKYGSRDNKCTCALWSRHMEFDFKGKHVSVTSDPPECYPWTCFGGKLVK